MTPADEHGTIDQLLPLYANGSLDVATRRRISAHLEACADCREELRFLGDVRQVLRQSVAAERVATPPAEARFDSLPPELQLRVRDGARKRQRPALAIAAGVAATLFAAVTLGMAVTLTPPQEPLYRTATSGSTAAAGHIRISIRFGAATEFGQVNRLLREYRAVIVRGPDERDQWLLEIPVGGKSDAGRLVPALRATPGIESVEPVGTPEAGE